jgi:hypothetical protein
MGHSSIRVTQEVYVHVTTDVYDRFYDATSGAIPGATTSPLAASRWKLPAADQEQ